MWLEAICLVNGLFRDLPKGASIQNGRGRQKHLAEREKMGRVNYEALDRNIVELVRALNIFPGVTTVGSCGRHTDPGPGQWPQGRWYVRLEFEQDKTGWLTLEFLA